MLDYQDTYSRMSNYELLDLALERDTLTPLANITLQSELKQRGLGTAEVAKREVFRREAQFKPISRKPLAQSFNGFGTKIYGKRDFQADGSFVSTKWVILLWIPVFPLKSLRVRYTEPGLTSIPLGWSRSYCISAEYQPDPRQVVATYAFIALFFLGGCVLIWLRAGYLVSYCAFGVWTSIPWILRRLAKR